MSVVVLVGACSDVAQTAAKALDQHDFVLVSRDVTRLPEELTEKYPSHSCDPCDYDAVAELFSTLSSQYEISAVVHFCGNTLLKSAAMISAKEWQSTIDINLNSAFNVAHAVTKYIAKNCSLVFFSTAAAHVGLPNHEAIAAAKAGVEGLSRSIAASYAKMNIRSNVIAPGLVQTKLTSAITKHERGRNLSLAMHALHRFGESEDIVAMIELLINPKYTWITGEVLRIDGGLSTVKQYPS